MTQNAHGHLRFKAGLRFQQLPASIHKLKKFAVRIFFILQTKRFPVAVRAKCIVIFLNQIHLLFSTLNLMFHNCLAHPFPQFKIYKFAFQVSDKIAGLFHRITLKMKIKHIVF